MIGRPTSSRVQLISHCHFHGLPDSHRNKHPALHKTDILESRTAGTRSPLPRAIRKHFGSCPPISRTTLYTPSIFVSAVFRCPDATATENRNAQAHPFPPPLVATGKDNLNSTKSPSLEASTATAALDLHLSVNVRLKYKALQADSFRVPF
ncbi:hypothetical protein EJ02DRAFT_63750 [Clathrospora elynae]|uniref:Uncharacterized protein n=1 Tax=Clathrospora elynae TaxID=706981 RepID=A0A6A5S974_9PLEO|nr:hypothetical protein EJ02DRAFT_63750 [Clathrospora elynae]